ncbi:TPA: hypothetical protein ACXIGP_001791 [Pseudomonas aeruginosa]|uniref:hypothetical protein n=1 Tax=Pseudomonas aeruginosa TaxID=287 RepID=UPI000B24AE55|nr:hypothetical protein [Pseudomonas aeruginosa]MCS7497085.1 hypothetical protein [Pseudomonas aeruginosa]MDO2896671.1 hypothetical protein [Pseudomonas aeruginosa]
MNMLKHKDGCPLQGDPAFYTNDLHCTCRSEQNGRIGFNIYKHWFVAQCPNDGEQIYYKLQIRTTKTIFVEHIKAATALIKAGIQEQIADQLHDKFGGELHLFGTHQGVELESVRLDE